MTAGEKRAQIRASGAVAVVLGLLTVGALLLRVVGIDYMLPYQLEPDHGVVRTAAWLDRPADVTQEGPWAGPSPIYPWLMARILQVLPGHSYPRILPPDAPIEEHLAAASEPFVRTRLLAAFFSLLAVPLVYFVARRVLGRGPSLLAAAFLATSVLLQNYGQQGRAHGAIGGLSVLSMVCVLAIPSAPTWRNYLAAGAASGLALACLQTGGFAVPALLVAHLFAPRPRKHLALLSALGLVAVGVALFYPSIYTLVPLKREGTFSVGITERLLTLSPAWEGLTGIPDSLWGSEPVLTLAALLGGVLAVARLARKPRPPREVLAPFLICTTFVVLLIVFWATFFPFRPRYLTSLLPFLAVLAAYGARQAGRALSHLAGIQGTRAAPAVLSSALLLALPAFTCARLCWLRWRPDTAAVAAGWIEAHADRESDGLALGPFFDLPLFGSREGIQRIPDALRSHWQRYQMRLPHEPGTAWTIHPLLLRPVRDRPVLDRGEIAAVLESSGARFAAVGDRGPEAAANDETRGAARQFYGDPSARFPALRHPGEEGPYPAYDLGPDALRVILTAKCWGFPVEIYGRTR